MTQKELAEKLGVTDVSLNATLKEGKDPRLSTLQKIADVLEIKITDLLSDGTEQTLAEEQPVALLISSFTRTW
ncbi:MAG: helix-turn-helix transcriptional regulator [Muribaculaceae bacterium]|nr:helix-turn-helix transcriptional regulator [Muribaculaceae bacterium]